MEDNERRNHSDFVVGDDESMSEGEDAEAPQAVYARQQIDAAALEAKRMDVFGPIAVAREISRRPSRPGSAVPSRPASAVPSPMRRPSSALRPPPPQLGPTAEEEAMADEAQQFAEDTHAATAVQGAVEQPPDLIPVQDFIDNGTFDDVMQDLEAQNFEAMLEPPTYDGHD